MRCARPPRQECWAGECGTPWTRWRRLIPPLGRACPGIPTKIPPSVLLGDVTRVPRGPPMHSTASTRARLTTVWWFHQNFGGGDTTPPPPVFPTRLVCLVRSGGRGRGEGGGREAGRPLRTRRAIGTPAPPKNPRPPGPSPRDRCVSPQVARSPSSSRHALVGGCSP